jgi:putative ABC transport system ATP-binding protein
MISLRNVTFEYRQSTFTLSIPRLDINSGEHVAITGPSGCGKTTLLQVLAGILKPASGEVQIGDTRLTAMSDSERRRFRITAVGQVFQDFELLESLSLVENILLPFRINGALKLDQTVRDRGSTLAKSVGLSEFLGRPVTKLSQGERQRVAICRAVIAKPSLILADEPTGNLDSRTKLKTMKLLHEQARTTDATLIVVTHDHSLLGGFDRTIDFAEIAPDSLDEQPTFEGETP